MIKESELRIGNTIYRTWKKAVNKSTDNVTIGILMDLVANGTGSAFNYEPIPLTEEWLLKLGFRKNQNSEKYFLPIPNIKCEIHAERFRGVIVLEIHNHVMPIIPETESSVHGLQNLYFALTGAELTVA